MTLPRSKSHWQADCGLEVKSAWPQTLSCSSAVPASFLGGPRKDFSVQFTGRFHMRQQHNEAAELPLCDLEKNEHLSLKDARISSIKIKSPITTTGIQRESQRKPTPPTWITPVLSKALPSADGGIRNEEGTVLVLRSSRSPEGWYEPRDPEGCEEVFGEGAKPLGRQGLGRTLKGAPELTEHPRLKEETHGKAQGWQLSRGNPPGRVLSNKKKTFKYTIQEREVLFLV